jgi:dTDP-4-dehydrorhamnose 3,5-epimerase
MPITIIESRIPEVKIITGTRFHDTRGFFSESYKEREFEQIGLPRFVQDNFSKSSRGVIRGLHWQKTPYGQGKLISCISGAILDVAVDIRKNSPNFGKHIAIELNESEPKMLWVPEGFAHGFQSLEDNSRVSYKVTNYWNPSAEKSVNFSCSEINIDWPLKDFIASEKDMKAPNLCDLDVE